MSDDQQSKQQLAWKYWKGRDILELWGEDDDDGTRIHVPGAMVRQLTQGVAFEDLPNHTRNYILGELYLRPKAYGGKVLKKD